MPNRYDLNGKVALVTGGASGIGRAIAQLLHNSGAQVHVWDLKPLEHKHIRSWAVDVTQPAQIDKAIRELVAAFRCPHILVNDAGYLGLCQNFADHDRGDWQRILAVNLVGTLQVTHAVVPYMKLAGGGRIINMGSLAGKEGLGTLAAYSAASGGVVAFTKALSRELAGDNIFVNCIAPGPIDTGMIRGLGEAAVERMIADSPVKRLGEAEEVAQLVAWLASDASRFNTGAVFDMSGGRARY